MNYHSAAGTGQPNGSASRREKLSTQRHPADDNRMHPALRSWREELPTSSYLGAVALLSIGAAHVSQSPKVMTPITPVHQPEWIEVERPFPAFALSIPEAADMPARYVIRRHAEGGGRKDILTLGEPDSVSLPFEVAKETTRCASTVADEPLASKFGPLLAAGSEPKIGAVFAKAELNRSYCGQRDPILAATPKYRLLWKAIANRPEPRRIGR
jgi:hypothetical protein